MTPFSGGHIVPYQRQGAWEEACLLASGNLSVLNIPSLHSTIPSLSNCMHAHECVCGAVVYECVCLSVHTQVHACMYGSKHL